MNQTNTNDGEQFIIGSDVLCTDKRVGELTRVVVDPIARAITHLVVDPEHRKGAGHLVPVDLVSSALEGQIRLRCSASDFSTLDRAEEIQFLPGANGSWEYQQSQMLTVPYYPLVGSMGSGVGTGPEEVVSDVTPAGDVDVRRGDHVHATDGAIGHVQGLVVDPSDHSVTHVLLQEGHLWGKKTVAIPIAVVTGVDDVVRLSLSKHEVEELPAVEVDHPN